MTPVKPTDFTGYSDSGLDDALTQALQQAGDYHRVEVVETRSSHTSDRHKSYQVTITTYQD